jgi:predicted nucleotide-binding protein
MATDQLPTPSAPDGRDRKVFVVGGRDQQVQRLVFDLLRTLGLRPLDWESLVAAAGCAAPSLLDVLDHNMSPDVVQAVVVLMTPDDVVALHPELHGAREHGFEVTDMLQARPDVLIETGMALARFGRERTVIVEFGTDLRPISDIGGINVVRFPGTGVRAAVLKLAARLRVAGCPVEADSTDQVEVERFASLDAYARRPRCRRLRGRLPGRRGGRPGRTQGGS